MKNRLIDKAVEILRSDMNSYFEKCASFAAIMAIISELKIVCDNKHQDKITQIKKDAFDCFVPEKEDEIFGTRVVSTEELANSIIILKL